MTKAQEERIGYQPGKTASNNAVNYIVNNGRSVPERTALKWVDQSDLIAWDNSAQTRFPHRIVTYGGFNESINAVAGGLLELGIRKGDRVIIFLPMGVPMYAAMFAVQKLGAIAVFLDSWARRTHLGAGAECVEPKAMISHHAAFELVNPLPEFKDMDLRIIAGSSEAGQYDARLEDLLESGLSAPMAAVSSEDTALITFTTGSSGTPKGANRTHRFLCAQHEALSKVVPYNENDVDMPAFPIFSLNNLASGVTTLLPAVDLAAPSDRDAAAMVNQILNEGVTCATVSPSMLRGIARFCGDNAVTLPGLRRVVSGGAAISRDNVADFKNIAPQAELWILYGSTEVEPMAHIEASEMLAMPVNPDPEIVEEGVNVGHISDDLDYRFIRIVRGPIKLDERGWEALELPVGEIGEFIVSGDHVCRDYYNNTEAFRKAKIMDNKGCVWHRTGDLGRLGSDGNLWIVGRIHTVIKRSGDYHFPVRAEVILNRLPFVQRGAFVGFPDGKKGECTAVAVSIRKNACDTETAVNEIRRVFRKNEIPVDAIYVVEDIPMDPRHHSKVEYDQLRRMIEVQGLRNQLDD